MHGTGVSTVTAFTAHREWATRPPDERFDSVLGLCDAAVRRRLHTGERQIDTVGLGTQAVTDDVLALRDVSGRTAALTHWSFEQLAAIAGAPPKYLRTLPAPIASAAINHGLHRQRREQHLLFTDRAEPWTVHAITSPRYARGGFQSDGARRASDSVRLHYVRAIDHTHHRNEDRPADAPLSRVHHDGTRRTRRAVNAHTLRGSAEGHCQSGA